MVALNVSHESTSTKSGLHFPPSTHRAIAQALDASTARKTAAMQRQQDAEVVAGPWSAVYRSAPPGRGPDWRPGSGVLYHLTRTAVPLTVCHHERCGL